MKKIVLFLNVILLIVILVSCNKNVGEEPDTKTKLIWDSEILKDSHVDIDGVTGIGMSIKSKEGNTVNFSADDSSLKMSYFIDDSYGTDFIIESTMLVVEINGEIKDIEFLGGKEGIEYDIFKLLVEKDFTFFTISPRSETGMVFKMEMDHQKGEEVKENFIVSRMHPNIQHLISMGEIWGKKHHFDRTGYITNDIFQSYILENSTGIIYQFPPEVPDDAFIVDGVIVTKDYMISVRDAIENNNVTNAIPILREDLDIHDIYVDKFNNIFVYNHTYHEEFSNYSVSYFGHIFFSPDSPIEKMFLDEEGVVYKTIFGDEVTKLFTIGKNLENVETNINKTIFPIDSILNKYSINDSTYGIVRMFKNGDVIISNEYNKHVFINHADNRVAINGNREYYTAIIDKILYIIEADPYSSKNEIANIYFKNIEELYDEYLSIGIYDIPSNFFETIDISQFDNKLALRYSSYVSGFEIELNDGRVLKKYKIAFNDNSLELVEIYEKIGDLEMIIELVPIN